jgi:Concanavalin A-like lectin/glucanases superfamily/PEP-CTERM motif
MKKRFLTLLTFPFLTLPLTSHAQIPTTGLVAKYDFSGNASDSAGFTMGINAIVHGATPTIDRFGNANSAYHFDGFTNYLDIADNDIFSVTNTGAITITAWVRIVGTSLDPQGRPLFATTENAVPDYVHWLQKGTTYGASGNQEWAARIYSADNTVGRENRTSIYAFNPTGGLGAGSYVQEPVTPASWLHFGFVIDANVGTTTIFKNGTQRDQDVFTSVTPNIVPQNGTSPVYVGHGGNSFFAGDIDDIRIYNRTLSATEMSQLFVATAPVPEPTTLSLLALGGITTALARRKRKVD